MVLIFSSLLIILFSSTSAYHRECKYGWKQVGRMCFRELDERSDFSDALEKCVHYARDWDDPPRNLMSLTHLHNFFLGHNHPRHEIYDHGPFRLNAIRNGGMWWTWTSGSSDVYLKHFYGGIRTEGFNQFPDFDDSDAHDGDTIVYYPHSHSIKAVQHWKEYPALCVHDMSSQKGHNCPGTPECNMNGYCLMGHCYCWPGYAGQFCKARHDVFERFEWRSVLVVNGDTNNLASGANFVYLLDLIDETVCQLPNFDAHSGSFASEGAWIDDKPVICGGEIFNNDDSMNKCYTMDFDTKSWQFYKDIPHRYTYFPSLLTPEGWWLLGDYYESKETDILTVDGTWISGPELPFQIAYGCACMISETTAAIIGGERSYDDGLNWAASDKITTYDFIDGTFSDVATLLNPREFPECEMIVSDNGEKVVVILGGGDNTIEWWNADTNAVTDSGHSLIFSDAEDQELMPYTTDTLVMVGGMSTTTGLRDDKIYKYTLADGLVPFTATLPVGTEEVTLIPVPDGSIHC